MWKTLQKIFEKSIDFYNGCSIMELYKSKRKEKMDFKTFQNNLHYIEKEYGFTPKEAKDVLVIVQNLQNLQSIKFTNKKEK